MVWVWEKTKKSSRDQKEQKKVNAKMTDWKAHCLYFYVISSYPHRSPHLQCKTGVQGKFSAQVWTSNIHREAI